MRVIFTNGCFDILHRAHIELLEFCSKAGDKVVVGLNTDASVKRLKGENRPINNEKDRKFLLESIRFVDEVFLFGEDTPYDLIKSVRPHTIVKGGDYTPATVVGNDLCDVIIFNYVDGYSTTKTLARGEIK